MDQRPSLLGAFLSSLIYTCKPGNIAYITLIRHDDWLIRCLGAHPYFVLWRASSSAIVDIRGNPSLPQQNYR